MAASLSTIRYLPAPIKAEAKFINEKPSSLNWVIYTVALGILAISAPKFFFVASAGTIIYQVYHFNHLVHSADKSQHREIREWAIKACQVIGCVAVVFYLQSLPCFWLALVSIKNLHLFHCAGHVAQAGLMIGIGKIFEPFGRTAFDLAKYDRWILMENYVENLPDEDKKAILSSYWKQSRFFIASLLPAKEQLGIVSSTIYRWFISDRENSLDKFFSHPNKEDWPYVVHLLQAQPIETRLSYGQALAKTVTLFSEEEQNQFPEEIKFILFCERLHHFQFLAEQKSLSDYHPVSNLLPVTSDIDEEEESLLEEKPIEKPDIPDTLIKCLDFVKSQPIRSFGTLPENTRLAALITSCIMVQFYAEDPCYKEISNDQYRAKLILISLGPEAEKKVINYLQTITNSRMFQSDKFPEWVSTATS